MHNRKKLTNIFLIAIGVIWTVLLLYSVTSLIIYSEPSAEPLDYYLTKSGYYALIIISAMGILSSLLLILNVNIRDKTRTINKISFAFGIADNILLYTFIILLLFLNKDFVFFFLVLWCACTVTCIVLQILCRALTKKIELISSQ